VTFEGDWPSYQTSYSHPSWTSEYGADRFYHIVYGVPVSSIPSALLLAQARNAGSVYFTEFGLPNPYGRLTSAWAAEVSAAAPPTFAPVSFETAARSSR
jgi:hypothetical protein